MVSGDTHPCHSIFMTSTRGSPNEVWELVKHIKNRFVHGTRIDCKWTHVCVVPITVKEAREKGDDVDSDGTRFNLVTCLGCP